MNWTNNAIAKEDPLFTRKIEMFVERRFLEKLYNSLKGNTAERKQGIHVSDLVYKCPRRAYYNHMMPPSMDLKGAIRVWTGIELHKTPLMEHSELTLEWNGIVGTIDEYENGFLMDKKTTRSVPTYYNRSRKEKVVTLRDHHKLQLEYYKVLLEENNYPVTEGGILYIDVNEAEVWFGRANFTRSNEEIKKEMISRKNAIELFLNARKLPPYNNETRWMCMGYCPFQQQCSLDMNPADFLSEKYMNMRWSEVNEALEEISETVNTEELLS